MIAIAIARRKQKQVNSRMLAGRSQQNCANKTQGAHKIEKRMKRCALVVFLYSAPHMFGCGCSPRGGCADISEEGQEALFPERKRLM
jgi:hypothetical protein